MDNLVPAIDFKQGEETILLMSLTAGDLKEISYFNTRDVDREEGLQRKFDNNRSREIAEFVSTDDAILSNNIILNLELKKNDLTLADVYEDFRFNIGKLKELVALKRTKNDYEKVAFVVDGQHRLRAFEKVKKDDFLLPVSVLIDLSLAEVAELFVQINYNQKPVNKSHVFDLLGISEKIFPKYYSSHQAVVLLQEDSSSPFYNKVKMLGVGKGFISQAALITAIEKYKIQKTIEDAVGSFDKEDIYNVLWHFFTAVEKVFENYWGDGKLLSKTVGIKALIKLCNDLLIKSFQDGEDFSSDYVSDELSKINSQIFEQEKILHGIGEKGVSTLYGEIRKELDINGD